MNAYQEIVETIPVFFFIWDTRKKETVFISENFYQEHLDDYHTQELPQENLRQYISQDSKSDYDEFFENLSTKDNYSGKIELRASESLNNIEWLHMETYPVKRSGETMRVAGYLRDISKEKEGFQMLSEQLKSLDVVAFMLAHELSAPVSNIMGLADLLKEKVTEKDRDEYLYLFDTIYNFGGEILTLARGMVSLINLQGLKNNNVNKISLPLRDFLEKEVEDFYFRDDQTKITIAYDLSEMARINADKNKLKLAIGELLLYLVKESKGQNNIIISMPQKTDEKYDDICIYSQGLNLPKDEIRKILDISAYLRLSDVQGKKISGMLELVIANEIIHLHGGRLAIYESEQNEGIKIQLPVSR